MSTAENYCRNFQDAETLWCYTTESQRWEFCDLPLCSAGQWLPRNGHMFWWLALHTFKTTMNCEQNSVRYINSVN